MKILYDVLLCDFMSLCSVGCVDINPKLRSIEFTKLLETYARNTKKRLNMVNNTNCFLH